MPTTPPQQNPATGSQNSQNKMCMPTNNAQQNPATHGQNSPNKRFIPIPRLCSRILQYVVRIHQTRWYCMPTTDPATHAWYSPNGSAGGPCNKCSLFTKTRSLQHMIRIHRTPTKQNPTTKGQYSQFKIS